MYRDIDAQLLAWSKSARRKPLVLCGARQVGKTYALRHLGESAYDSCAYINLLNEEDRDLFTDRYSARQVLENISVRTGTTIEPGHTLVIIDEIQEAPHALTLMKAFAEEMPEYHIASAGSYLGVAYHAGKSFPVGQVNMLDMYPMSYLEYLRASGFGGLVEWIQHLDFDRLAAFRNDLERQLRTYYYVGGMPAAVSDFLSGPAEEPRTNENFLAARSVQNELLTAYDHDFSKHIHDDVRVDPERVRLAFQSIPAHLSRENHKFIFSHIANGANRKQYETAIGFIVDSGLATCVHRISKIALPLRSYEDISAFKLYMSDIGLLGAAMDIDVDELLLGDSGMTDFKGAMTEQYVCQQLVEAGHKRLNYWTNGKSTSEIDFVFKHHGAAAPLEVKAEKNVHAKSLRNVCSTTGLHGYRSSMKGYKEQDWLTNVPLWAVGAYFAR